MCGSVHHYAEQKCQFQLNSVFLTSAPQSPPCTFRLLSLLLLSYTIGCVFNTPDIAHLRNTYNVAHERQHLYCFVESYFMCISCWYYYFSSNTFNPLAYAITIQKFLYWQQFDTEFHISVHKPSVHHVNTPKITISIIIYIHAHQTFNKYRFIFMQSLPLIIFIFI